MRFSPFGGGFDIMFSIIPVIIGIIGIGFVMATTVDFIEEPIIPVTKPRKKKEPKGDNIK